jgi:MSHA biogenesis protein MshP
MNLRVRRKSAGVAMVTAIFLLVALAGLAVAVVTLTASQQSASALDVQGQRAYQASRAGIEWALYIGLRAGSGTALDAATALGCTTATPTAPKVISFKLPKDANGNDTTLSSFTVTIQCGLPVAGVGDNTANDATANHFVIISTACNQPGANGNCPNTAPGAEYVQRQITAQL